MQAYEIIRKKRDGLSLTSDEIAFFLQGYTEGAIPDYQASAMAMAIFFQGLSKEELWTWTRGMLDSGKVFDLSTLGGYKVDKHSTGGVGDKTSLILAPLVAAAGLYVPMISGRGLGHTGGTLDKLEAIPGFTTRMTSERFVEVLKRCGLVLAGQSEDIVPADKKFYALRDVTATVESIPLIASSIMSKKLAEGLDGLVLDVKFGDGAFMKDLPKARILAETLVSIGASFGKHVVALLTEMEQPLGTHIGNSLEVIESCEILKGRLTNDLSDLSFRLAAEMLCLGGKAKTLEEGLDVIQTLVQSGAGYRKFVEITREQGGDARGLEDYSHLPQARGKLQIRTPHDGFLQAIRCEALGRLAVQLGAGRQTIEDRIDPAVGMILHAKVGASLRAGDPLVTLHYNDKAKVDAIREGVQAAFVVGLEPPSPRPLIADRIEALGRSS